MVSHTTNGDKRQRLELVVENTPTILIRVIQVIQRSRIPIHVFAATETDKGDLGQITIELTISDEQLEKTRRKLANLVDVAAIN